MTKNMAPDKLGVGLIDLGSVYLILPAYSQLVHLQSTTIMFVAIFCL